jgi:hypothetical protein
MKFNTPIHKPAASVSRNHSNGYDADFYEFRPYFYAIFAAACFYFKAQNAILPFSGALFGLASAAIFYMRFFARNYR